MRAWRVHEFGEPQDTFVLDEVPEPTGADLSGLAMGLAGWAPLPEGGEPFTDWVIMRMTVAALALPDVTMCRGPIRSPSRVPTSRAKRALASSSMRHPVAVSTSGVASPR